jgi:hypothetical protein
MKLTKSRQFFIYFSQLFLLFWAFGRSIEEMKKQKLLKRLSYSRQVKPLNSPLTLKNGREFILAASLMMKE